MRNALTFDVEEYFHAEAFASRLPRERWPAMESRVVGSTERLLALLDRARVRATFFVLGWVAERQPALVRQIHASGHEVACHGYEHRMIGTVNRDEFAGDVRRAKHALENIIGASVIGYRAPTFSVVRDTLWSLEVLCQAGFQYDSSIFPIRHDRYGIPDAPRFPHRRPTAAAEIVEFPPSTVILLGHRVPVAGGGYFRLFPYRLTRWAVRRLNERDRQPAMVYLHPWEVDPDQPRLPASWRTRFRHGVNITKTEDRLRRLVDDFDFAPASDILAEAGLLPAGAAR